MDVWLVQFCQQIALLSSQRLSFTATYVFQTLPDALTFLAQHNADLWDALCWYRHESIPMSWEARHPHDHTLCFFISQTTLLQRDPAAPDITVPLERVATTWDEHMEHLQWAGEDA